MKNYKEIALRYKKSGMTQTKFGIQEGISSSMVSYYVRKARRNSKLLNVPNSGVKSKNKFTSLELKIKEVDQKIIIRTPKGVEIEVPI